MKEFQQLLGYEFKDERLLETALTHSSYANERHCACNERLEFLGDSVLGLTVSRYLFEKMSDVNEGSLSKIRASLVCEESLAKVARRIELGRFIRLGRGEELQGGRKRDSILSDALEAVFAAVSLDGGFETAENLIKRVMAEELSEGMSWSFYHDYKTMLQELVQGKNHAHVTYNLVREMGPAHNKHFAVQAVANGKILAEGTGQSKKEAEQIAAKHALEKMGGR